MQLELKGQSSGLEGPRRLFRHSPNPPVEEIHGAAKHRKQILSIIIFRRRTKKACDAKFNILYELHVQIEASGQASKPCTIELPQLTVLLSLFQLDLSSDSVMLLYEVLIK